MRDWKPFKQVVRSFSPASVALGFTLAFVFAGTSSAQTGPWTFNVAGGFTPLTGEVHNRLNNGWHVTGGGGYQFDSHFSLGGEVMYNGFGVSRFLTSEAGVSSANAHLWAFTAQPRFDLAPGHEVDPYLVGGVGYYRRVVDFTTPTLVPVTIFDPFFGFSPILVAANTVIGSIVRNGIGGSAGIGFNFRIGDSPERFFVEARYHYASTGDVPMRMIPISVGLRF